MDFNQFLHTQAFTSLTNRLESASDGPVDLTRAASIEVDHDLYLEAESRGMTLSELLEADEYDPSPHGGGLDAFERQLLLAGIRVHGRGAATVEQFYQSAPQLLPEFMLREIRRGQSMRPELNRLVANSTSLASNRYTPFHVDTANAARFSLRPIGDGAEVPQLIVTEQNHAVNVTDYGLALKASYKALRYRSSSQFRVLLWYIGFRIQTDKVGMLVETLINGDGNNNAARVVNAATSGSLDYDDLITLWAQFAPFELNAIVCHIDQLQAILKLEEFKDPMAGYRFQNSGELFSPLGAGLIRCDDVPADLVIGLDSRFAVEEVITQPLTIEYDKIIDQRFEEAVISESATYAKVIADASVVLDTVFGG